LIEIARGRCVGAPQTVENMRDHHVARSSHLIRSERRKGHGTRLERSGKELKEMTPDAKPPTFRWSRKLVRVAGIDVYVHGTFLLLIAFVAFSDLVAGRGVTVMVSRTSLILAVFATVVLHELGHALTARRFGVRTRDIILLPIGGVARLEKMPDLPGQQLLVALAGPAMNLAVAALLFGVGRLFDARAGLEGISRTGGPFLTQLMGINVFLAVFNLLPGFPMDGGRVLRALLAMRMAPERATQTAARVGQAVALSFGLVGLFGNPLLIVIAVFVWLGAQAEHSASTEQKYNKTRRRGLASDGDEDVTYSASRAERA
jgi:Zn-dependent protease